MNALVLTDERMSGGWIGWMPAKMIPATIADSPDQRMSFEVVIFILFSLIAICLFHACRALASPGIDETPLGRLALDYVYVLPSDDTSGCGEVSSPHVVIDVVIDWPYSAKLPGLGL